MIPPELLVARVVWAFPSALVREVGALYFLVVLVVVASMVWILVAKVRPRRFLDWAVIASAAVIVDVIVLAVSCTDSYVAWAAFVLVVMVGLPGLTILSVIWSATRPRGR